MSDVEWLKGVITKAQILFNQTWPWCVELLNILEGNGITVNLYAGTLLGALRGGGPIPWDDDVDIYIPASQHDALEALASCHLAEGDVKYVVEKYRNEEEEQKLVENIEQYRRAVTCYHVERIHPSGSSSSTPDVGDTHSTYDLIIVDTSLGNGFFHVYAKYKGPSGEQRGIKVADIFYHSHTTAPFIAGTSRSAPFLNQVYHIPDNAEEWVCRVYGKDWRTRAKICNHTIDAYFDPDKTTYQSFLMSEIDEILQDM